MRRTLEQNKKFHLLLTLCSYDEVKKQELVERCTAGRTKHSHEMDQIEMQFAINELTFVRQNDFKRYMPVIALCCKRLGWTEFRDGMHQIDYRSLSAYIQKYYGKPGLSRLPAAEMNKLVISLKKIARGKGIKV